ncbi:MAG: hypothetical protein JO193_00645 [Candidatus Eremiobacteraeota bacterium]|nr:hypothetical protein [Candidatus Eremiobacteraeota bacterium]
MEVKPTYLGTMIALATAAFGLIAALAWNTAITDFFKHFFPAGQGILSEFIYAIIITIIAVLIVQNLARVADRQSGPRA